MECFSGSAPKTEQYAGGRKLTGKTPSIIVLRKRSRSLNPISKQTDWIAFPALALILLTLASSALGGLAKTGDQLVAQFGKPTESGRYAFHPRNAESKRAWLKLDPYPISGEAVVVPGAIFATFLKDQVGIRAILVEDRCIAISYVGNRIDTNAMGDFRFLLGERSLLPALLKANEGESAWPSDAVRTLPKLGEVRRADGKAVAIDLNHGVYNSQVSLLVYDPLWPILVENAVEKFKARGSAKERRSADEFAGKVAAPTPHVDRLASPSAAPLGYADFTKDKARYVPDEAEATIAISGLVKGKYYLQFSSVQEVKGNRALVSAYPAKGGTVQPAVLLLEGFIHGQSRLLGARDSIEAVVRFERTEKVADLVGQQIPVFTCLGFNRGGTYMRSEAMPPDGEAFIDTSK